MPEKELLYRIAFSSLKGMTCKFAKELLCRLGSEELFFSATTSQLKSLLGFDSHILDSDYRKDILESARREVDFVEKNRVRVFYFTEGSFPQRLVECDDSPPVLYGLGDCNLNSKHVISVVGTRHATLYGLGFVKDLIHTIESSLEDVVVVSGLAYGIDVASHKECLNEGMPTVGVLAHGLSTIYPSRHRGIAADMVKKGGILLTDYRHDVKPFQAHFIARNRIVAGLSDCTVVVESAEKGGALITADIAGGYNRDVFALPGRTSDHYSRGCNRLIMDNKATLIQNPEDILSFMGWKGKEQVEERKLFYDLNDDEKSVMDFLTANGEGFVNRIAIETGIPIHRLMGLLVDMEFKGFIMNMPGGIYRIKN